MRRKKRWTVSINKFILDEFKRKADKAGKQYSTIIEEKMEEYITDEDDQVE